MLNSLDLTSDDHEKLRSVNRLLAVSVEKPRVAGAESVVLNSARAPFLSGFARLLRCGKHPSCALALPIPCRAVLGSFAEVLGGGGEQEFFICATWSSQSQSSQCQNAFEMGKEHFNFLSELHCDLVLFGLGQISGDLLGIFVLFTSDLARISVGAAFLFGRADLANFF